ncbi:MAG: DUF6531 domain-containing protein [Segniliparus sp.]|uniref:DUF6531 domain-containing protein n=1 Tax=Segniliparus sp. TaxID=2804064 RepID=UPI003F32D295
MTVLQIDPDAFATAAKALEGVHTRTTQLMSSLAGKLQGCAGMAGNDGAGEDWGHGYDDGAKDAMAGLAALADGSANKASLLHFNGLNHTTGDASATIGGGDDSFPGAPSVAESTSPPQLPTSIENGGEPEPFGWELIKDLIDFLWPNGGVVKLGEAAFAWGEAAAELVSIGGDIPGAISRVQAQQSPEVATAVEHLQELHESYIELAVVFGLMAESCTEYAANLVITRVELVEMIVQLIAEIAMTEAEGAAGAVETFGASEVAAQAAVVAETAATAAEAEIVAGVLRRLVQKVVQKVERSAMNQARKVLQKILAKLRHGGKDLLRQAGKEANQGLKSLKNAAKAGLKGEKEAARDALEGAGNSWRKVMCKLFGNDPVDMATGEVMLNDVDVELPGVFPLRLARRYQSFFTAGRLFGPRWFSTLDQRLEVDHKGVVVVWEDGVLQEFGHPPVSGEPIAASRGPEWLLRLDQAGSSYELADPKTGEVKRFSPAPARAPEEGAGAAEVPVREIRDARGNWARFRYDEAGTPTRVEHSSGSVVLVDSANGLVTGLSLMSATELQSAAGYAVSRPGVIPVKSFDYDAAGNLVGFGSGPDSKVEYSYDGAGRITRWRDSNGIAYDYRYDERNRCVHQVGTNGVFEYTYAYEDLPNGGSATTFTNFAGASTRYEADSRSLIVAETDPIGNTTRMRWSKSAQLLSRTGPDGGRTEWTYTDDGDVATITRPDGRSASFEYASPGLVSRFVDFDGAATAYEHDEFGAVVAVTDPTGATTRVARGTTGAVVAVTDPLGNTTHVSVDAAGLPLSVTDPNQHVTRWERDLFGRVRKVVAPDGAATALAWTVSGDPLTRTNPDGGVRRWEYDTEGNLLAVTDELGNRKRAEYREFDQVRATVEADGSRTEYDWDPELRVTKVVNPAGMVWSYVYDAAGGLVRETDFNGREVRYERDSMGRVARRTNAGGQWVAFEYDQLGNVVAETTDEGETTRFAYDAAGRLLESGGPGGEVVWKRDVAGRVTEERVGGQRLRFAYDAAGRRVSMTTPAGVATEYEYDAAGDVVGQRTAGQFTRVYRDQLGRAAWLEHGGRMRVGRDFDRAGRMTNQRVVRDPLGDGLWNADMVAKDWAYDPAGKLTGVRDTLRGPVQFEFDERDRITAAHGEGPQGAWREEYGYDGSDNVTAFPEAASGPAEPAVLPGGLAAEYRGTLLVRAGRSRYEYDADGRLTQTTVARPDRGPDVWRYRWDAYDRLREVVTPDKTVWRYSYDGLGRRIGKRQFAADGKTGISETLFFWDGTRVVEATTPNGGNWLAGAESTTFAYEELDGFKPYAQVKTEEDERGVVDRKFYAIVTDLVGTPAELWDVAANSLAGATRTTLYGQTEWDPRTTQTCPLRFPGQYYDAETGLHYNYHRYYDPRAARYVSPDPLGLSPAPNQHSYPHDPTMWIDPLGLKGDCGPDIEGATYTQSSYRETFSARNKFGLDGESKYFDINSLVRDLRSGKISPEGVPIGVIVHEGRTLIDNTRSATALTRAGIPRSVWKVIDQTGIPKRVNDLVDRMKEDGIYPHGTSSPSSRGYPRHHGRGR